MSRLPIRDQEQNSERPWLPPRVPSQDEQPEPVPLRKQYSLLALVVLTIIGPPILAILWFLTHSIAGILAYGAVLAFWWLFYWMLRRSQAFHPLTRERFPGNR
jgi:protein-S-isoprenylcysteine O-methyltransferase Ste14